MLLIQMMASFHGPKDDSFLSSCGFSSALTEVHIRSLHIVDRQ